MNSESNPGLTVHAYDNGARMWEDIRDSWEDSQGDLVLPGAFSRQKFLRQESKTTIWTDRVIALRDFWVRLAQQLQTPGPTCINEPEANSIIAEVVADIPELEAVAQFSSGYTVLARQLDLIEKQADLTYQPQTQLEQGLFKLREKLMERGLSVRSGQRSYIARHAKELTLPRPLLLAPLPEPSRQLGGLAKGLARKNHVSLFVILPSELLDVYLSRLGVEDIAEIEQRFSNDSLGSALFSKGHSFAPQAEEKSRWAKADNQLAAAAEIAKHWIDAGAEPSRTAIICPDVELYANQLAQTADEINLPVFVREAISTNETIVGTLLLKLTKEKDEFGTLLTADGEQYLELSPEDLESLYEARSLGTLPELEQLYKLGRSLIKRIQVKVNQSSSVLEHEHAWLDGLEQALLRLKELEIMPLNLVELISSIESNRKERGSPDGVFLISYAEAPALEIDNACLIGMEAPPPRQTSPFVSEQLLSVCPELAPADPRLELSEATTAVAGKITFIKPTHVEGREPADSAFWIETQRAYGRSVTTEHLHDEGLRAPRRLARGSARKRIGNYREIRETLEQISRERLAEEIGSQPRRSYSVTELENYLSCPYGWFIARGLAPSRRPSVNAARGTLNHNALATVFSPELENQRLDSISTILNDLGSLSERERELLTRQLARVVNKFGGAGWYFDHHYCEIDLEYEFEDEGESYKLRGIADRIDIKETPEGSLNQMLVIDYKSGQAPKFTKHSLQPFLYPLMAEAKYQAKPLGFLYISIRYAQQRGSLTTDVPGLDPVDLRYDWERQAQAAITNTKEAIKNIENGLWSQIGSNCADYCAHRLLSETGLLR